eukprot:480739-Heterocapsa_arctica.AAC.1
MGSGATRTRSSGRTRRWATPSSPTWAQAIEDAFRYHREVCPHLLGVHGILQEFQGIPAG